MSSCRFPYMNCIENKALPIPRKEGNAYPETLSLPDNTLNLVHPFQGPKRQKERDFAVGNLLLPLSLGHSA